MRVILATLLVVGTACAPVAAEPPGPTQGPGLTVAQVRSRLDLRLPEADRVLATRSARTQPGGPGRPTRTHWAARHPVLLGSVVGFAGGCVLGVSQVGGSTDTFFNALDELACPVVGGIGAGIGAAVGALVSR